jgi:hypothetical protein
MNKIILCVGCSWTYGHGLPADQTYPAHLQNALSEYTVINAGHCGADINYAIFSAVRLIEEYNPCLVIFQLTTLDRLTIGTDGYDNFLNDMYYDGRDDSVYFENDESSYKRVIGIADNNKTKITHASYMASDDDINLTLLESKSKNIDLKKCKNFISVLVENILHSNYTNQRLYNDLFLFQKYLELKKINLQYFYWIPFENRFKESFNSKLFNKSKLISEPVTTWMKRTYPQENYFIDNGYHFSNEGNKLLVEGYLLPYIKKLL